jgi:hypothetical protein
MHTMSWKTLVPTALAAAALVRGAMGVEARAGQIPFPAALDALEPAGTYAIVGNLEFSNFTYIPDPGLSVKAGDITITPFTSVSNGNGITLNAEFHVPAGGEASPEINFEVTALTGTISGAYLSGVQDTAFGTGELSVAANIFEPGNSVGFASISFPGFASDSITLDSPQTAVFVREDLVMVGGSEGVSLASISNGFSPSAVPEPSSLALCGLGLAGIVGHRLRRGKVATA